MKVATWRTTGVYFLAFSLSGPEASLTARLATSPYRPPPHYHAGVRPQISIARAQPNRSSAIQPQRHDHGLEAARSRRRKRLPRLARVSLGELLCDDARCVMTTLVNRHSTALVVIDVQNGVVDGAVRRDEVVAAIAGLVERARREGVAVVWVQHASEALAPGTPDWEYVPELVRDPSEPLLHKQYGDAFEDTELEAMLGERRVGRLVVAGAQTDVCIRSTLHGALVRGYDVTLVSDAHTTEDLTEWGAPPPEQVIAHTNLYWSDQQAPGRTANTMPSDEVTFAPV